MKFIKCYLLLFTLLNLSFHQSLASDTSQKYKVALLVMATGKYTVFLEKLFKSADTYFLTQHEVTYFVFTDGQVPISDHIIKVPQTRLGWPFDTMMRFEVYYTARTYFSHFDYIFACDADMLFVDAVGDEILGERVATRHPCFGFSVYPFNRHDDYERNPSSTAFIPQDKGEYYFAGGFYGGSKDEFLNLCKICGENVRQDLTHSIVAKWHDESHLNRYFLDNKPTMILSPSYCYPLDGPLQYDLPFPKKLCALTKDHKEFQTAK